MGYYDEENPEVTDREIKWALEHGINCFIHCWYRYKHNMGKPVTANDLRCAHGLHEALFNAKHGNMMKFAIMFGKAPNLFISTLSSRIFVEYYYCSKILEVSQ